MIFNILSFKQLKDLSGSYGVDLMNFIDLTDHNLLLMDVILFQVMDRSPSVHKIYFSICYCCRGVRQSESW